MRGASSRALSTLNVADEMSNTSSPTLNTADVEKFRAAVVKYLVPVADKVYREQAKRLGKQYPMSFADNALEFRSGNPRPVGTSDEILAQGMKHVLSVLGLDVAVEFHIEIVVPHQFLHRAALQGAHVETMGTDDIQSLCKRTCLVLYREGQDEMPSHFGLGFFGASAARKSCKPGGVGGA